MSGDYPRSRQRRMEAVEERLSEIRHRLVIEGACGETAASGAANVPGFLETEEELLDEAAELERVLAAREDGDRAPRSSFSSSKKGPGR